MRNTNNKEFHRKSTFNSTRRVIVKSVLNNFNSLNHSQDQKRIIVDVVKAETEKVIISKVNLSNLSFRKRVTLDVTLKSATKLKDIEGINVRKWIPKPELRSFKKINYKKNVRVANWIPKPIKR